MNQQNAFEYVLRSRGTRPAAELHAVSDEAAERAQRFHAGFPG